MKTALLVALLGATAMACAASPNDDNTDSSTAHVEAPSAGRELAPGKYVVNGKMLMIYSTCSSQNFLGDAAKGAIDGMGVIHAEEGDVCGGYHLSAVADGEIKVTWQRDPTAHLGSAEAGCMSIEGTYLMMQPSTFVEPKTGEYVNGDKSLVVPPGCATPPMLSAAGAVVATATYDEAHPAGFLATEEGDVCSGYTYTAQPGGSVRVTWTPPTDASVVHDASVASGCKSLEGVYTPR